jgi:transcriptional regulator with XRE-family HTH domain
MDIHVFIQKKLRDEGYTQPALAKKIGCSQGTVSNLLTGATNVRTDIKYKVARAFGLHLDAFENDNIVAESSISYQPAPLSSLETRLLKAFRVLDHKRKERFIEMVEDMATARRLEARETS